MIAVFCDAYGARFMLLRCYRSVTTWPDGAVADTNMGAFRLLAQFAAMNSRDLTRVMFSSSIGKEFRVNSRGRVRHPPARR